MAAEILGGATESAHDEDVLVVIVRGANAPGVTSALVALVEQSGDQVFILDIAQYILEGSLVLTIMLRFEDASPVKLMRDMLDAARRLGMQAQFHFPAPSAKRESSLASTVVSITVAVPNDLPLDLVHGILAYVSATDGQVLEIGHQLEDTVGLDGRLACVRFRVSFCADVLVSKLYLDMQKQCRKHCAEVAVREWDALTRPNGKSLIVFGLSDVLCPYDIVDELLREAGVDPRGAEQAAAKTHETTSAAKLKLLEGKPAECQARLVERLRFTPGAREVCRFLKDLGFRLALLTLTGGDVVSKAVKQELGLDYAISPSFGVDDAGKLTGQYTGWNADMQLRKADYLQLMAEKELIDLRNVIVVGSFMRGMPKETVQNILDTYGPTLYFHAPKMPDLTVILHLLGFTGKDLQALPSSRPMEAAAASALAAVPAEDTCRCLLRVHSKESDAGKFAKLLEPLARYQQSGSVTVLSMEQATIASGDAFLGLQLVLGQSQTDAVLKDLLFEGRRVGLDMDWDLQKALPGKEASCKDVSKIGQYVITLVQKPELQVSCLCAVFRQCSDLGVDLIRLDRLSRSRLYALQITASVPDGIEAALRSGLLATSKAFDVDIAFQRDGVERWGRRLIVFDMDSTLIQQEVIDELAKLAGVESIVGEITERAMRGELDFHQSLRERVALLKGHNAKELFDSVKKDLVYTPGAERLCRTLKQLGYKMAVISGGFIPMAREVQSKLGLDYAFANTLQVDQNGLLTGETIGPVVTPERKRALLSMIAEVEGCDVRQTIAVGDGSNDIPMLCAAGLGVAFCAKPKVQAVAEFRVNNKDLSTVLFLIGLSESATHSLAGADS